MLSEYEHINIITNQMDKNKEYDGETATWHRYFIAGMQDALGKTEQEITDMIKKKENYILGLECVLNK